MSASPASWSRRADAPRVAVTGAFAVAAFFLSWGLLHRWFWAHGQIVDTPGYQDWGDAIAAGRVPYRDVGVDYPPGSVPVFWIPSLISRAGDSDTYVRAFEIEMLVCGACLVGFVTFAL